MSACPRLLLPCLLALAPWSAAQSAPGAASPPAAAPGASATAPAGASSLSGAALASAPLASAPLANASVGAPDLQDALAAEVDGRWNDALRLYVAATAISPDDISVALGLARVHTAQGRAWEAATLLEHATVAHPDSVRLLRATGDAILAAGSTTMALEAYDRALAVAPDDVGVRCAAAWAAIAGRRSDRLLELLAPVPLASLTPSLQRALGRAALLGNKPELAAAALEAFLLGEAGHPPATAADDVQVLVDVLLDTARARVLLSQDTAALETLRLVLAQQPDCAAAYVLLGHLRLRGSQRELALASYEEAIRRGADAGPLAPLMTRLAPAGHP